QDAAWNLADEFLGSALLGHCARASSMSHQILTLSNRQEIVWRTAVALALCGRGDEAVSLGNKLVRGHPNDTLVNVVWVPLIRGAAVLQRRHSAEAVAILEPALRYDFAYEAVGYPNYIRGLAYLAQHDRQNALAEFDKILSHRYLYRGEAHYSLA
ncbi:MAG: hypothetical protein DMF57_17480, partial [Acidobacteria bacterium]